MSDVFISYAREDGAQAERIARGLEAAGLNVFWDNEIPPGQTWADYIEGKLNQCAAAVVLWSEHSTKSQWVREEARMGARQAYPREARRIAEPPFGFGDVQAADLSHWGGDSNHPRMEPLRQRRGRESARWAWRRNLPQSAPQRAAATASRRLAAPPPPSCSNHNQVRSKAAARLPIAYIQKCLRLYVDGKGRARRAEFGWFFVFTFVVGFRAAIFDIMTSGFNHYTRCRTQTHRCSSLIAFALALIAPTVSAASRRAARFWPVGLARGAWSASAYLGSDRWRWS